MPKEKEVKTIVFFQDGSKFEVISGDKIALFNSAILNSKDLEKMLSDLPTLDYLVNVNNVNYIANLDRKENED